MSIGPEYTNLGESINFILSFFTLNVDGLKFYSDVYWRIFYVILSLTFLWFFLIIAFIFKFEVKFEKYWFFKTWGKISFILLPLLGQFCFLPIIFILTDLFVCVEGRDLNFDQKIDFSESIMGRDCSVFCYTTEHLNLSYMSVLGLLLYVPVAIVAKPHWQDIKVDRLNLRAKPSFLIY